MSAKKSRVNAVRKHAPVNAEVKWVDDFPPARANRTGSKYGKILAELRERKNKPALIAVCGTAQGAGQLAGNIRNGKAAGSQPQGSFEAVSRGVEVYAKFVGA